MCFFLGGLTRSEQSFNTTVASTMSSLMAVATASLIIPAALYSTLELSDEKSFELVLTLSRGTSVVLLVLYVMYLVFQLKTHTNLFEEQSCPKSTPASDQIPGAVPAPAEQTGSTEKQQPVLSIVEGAIVLITVTLAVAVCAEYLVGSIDSVVANSGVSKTFIGLILIPIVGNAAEHVTAVVVAMKDKVCSALF